QEREAFKLNGFIMLLVALLVLVLMGITIWLAYVTTPVLFVLSVLLFLVELLILIGFVMIQPNDSRVLTFFGKYAGSIKENGFYWVNPLAVREKVSLKINNFNSEIIKVNDADGNPILIAAVVVWRV